MKVVACHRRACVSFQAATPVLGTVGADDDAFLVNEGAAGFRFQDLKEISRCAGPNRPRAHRAFARHQL